jgi:hypothetical protein
MKKRSPNGARCQEWITSPIPQIRPAGPNQSSILVPSARCGRGWDEGLSNDVHCSPLPIAGERSGVRGERRMEAAT